MLGYVDQARELGDKALALAQHLDHPYTLARTLYYDTILRQFSREWQTLCEQADAAIAVATEQGVALVLALCPIMRGWAVAMRITVPRGWCRYVRVSTPIERPRQSFNGRIS